MNFQNKPKLYTFVKLTYGLVFVILFFSCHHNDTIEKEEIDIVFRFDDFSSVSNTKLELELIELFKENGLSFTVSAIPFVNEGDEHDFSKQNLIPLSDKKAEILKKGIKDKVIDLALHGYSHQVTIEQNNEFGGLSLNEQFRRLSKGKAYLEEITGTTIRSFIPPWNSYDLNTLKALDSLNFNIISADRERVYEKKSKLNFIPYTCQIPQLSEALKEARNYYQHKPTIIVMFHEYDFIEDEPEKGIVSLSELKEILTHLNNQKDVNVLSLTDLEKKYNHFKTEQYSITKKIFELNKFIPSFLKANKTVSMYKNQKGTLIKLTVYASIIYGMLLVFSAILARFLGCFILKKSNIVFKTALILFPLLTTAFIIYVFHDFIFGYKALIISVVLIGISTGLYLAAKNYISNKKRP